MTARNIPLIDRQFIAIPREISLDIQCCALLLLLTAIMVLPRALTLPMELYDESRVANNALEMARHGGWMVPTFGDVPDHWNTKPPLLIWIMAVLLRTGMNPMLAIRLPSIAATMGSVLLVYATCRIALHDRKAGMIGGLLVICSLLFMGDHVGRTGDYDAFLAFLTLGFVICAGRYIDAGSDRSAFWIGASAVLLLLAIMTKGIAPGMAVPGLAVYAIARGRLLAIMRDWRLWVAAAAIVAGMACWLALRERLDPGYLAAVWYNDVNGRFMTALEQHDEPVWYYLKVLALTFEPGLLLLPTLLYMRNDRDPARRQLCWLMGLTAISWLVAISAAGSKCYWYVAPVVPLFAIAIGTATTTFLRRPDPPLSSRVVIRPIIVTLSITFWMLNVQAPDANRAYAADQVWYGTFLTKIRGEVPLDNAVIVDLGLANDAGFQHYNPIARFFAGDADWHGENIKVVTPSMPIANATTIISCDPRVRNWLTSRDSFKPIRADSRCIAGRATMPVDGSK